MTPALSAAAEIDQRVAPSSTRTPSPLASAIGRVLSSDALEAGAYGPRRCYLAARRRRPRLGAETVISTLIAWRVNGPVSTRSVEIPITSTAGNVGTVLRSTAKTLRGRDQARHGAV